MFYKGKNVLVTGGAGLIGQSLVLKLLDEGAHVRATEFHSRKISTNHKNLEIVRCDLRNPESARAAFKDMEIVFLAAGVVRGAKEIKNNASRLIMENLELRARQIYLAAQMGAERCAMISSSYVYPETGEPNIESEGFQGDPWIPVNYGMGWLERYLETLCKHFHLVTKTKYAVVRPTAVYGPHDVFDLESSHVIPALIMKAANRMDPFEVWGQGEEIRSFTYVEDLAEGLLLTLEKYAVAEALNLCTREIHSVRDVIKMIFDLLEFHPTVSFRPERPSLVPYKVSDPSRAKELIQWEAKVSLKEGLEKTMAWYLENKPSLCQGSR